MAGINFKLNKLIRKIILEENKKYIFETNIKKQKKLLNEYLHFIDSNLDLVSGDSKPLPKDKLKAVFNKSLIELKEWYDVWIDSFIKRINEIVNEKLAEYQFNEKILNSIYVKNSLQVSTKDFQAKLKNLFNKFFLLDDTSDVTIILSISNLSILPYLAEIMEVKFALNENNDIKGFSPLDLMGKPKVYDRSTDRYAARKVVKTELIPFLEQIYKDSCINFAESLRNTDVEKTFFPKFNDTQFSIIDQDIVSKEMIKNNLQKKLNDIANYLMKIPIY